MTSLAECGKIGAQSAVQKRLNYFAAGVDIPDQSAYNIFIVKEEKMKKDKKVEPTKAALVAKLEEAVKVNKGFLGSLERANKETIVRLIEICS